MSRLSIAAPAGTSTALSKGHERLIVALAIVVGAAAAAYSGLNVGVQHTGTSGKLLVVLPIALVVAAGLGALAYARFEVFILVCLVVRSTVDISKITSRAGGSTVPNTGSHAADPSSILAVALIAAGILWLAARRWREGSLPGSRLRTWLVLMVLAGYASVIGDTTKRLTSSVEGLRVLSIVVMFAVLEQLTLNERFRRWVYYAILGSAIVPLSFTFFGFAVGHPATELKGGFTRIIGTFHQSNDYGRYLMLIIIFAVAVYPHMTRRLQLWLMGGIALSGVFLLLTYTRSALIGTIVGLALVGKYQSKRLLRVLGVVCVLALLLVPSLASRFTSVTSTNSLAANAVSHSGDSFSWRLGYWTQVLPLADQNPITGIGLGETQYNTDQAKAPHNDYIRAYVETGLLGLVAYLGMLVALIRLSRKAIKVAVRGTLDHSVAVATFASAVAYVLVSAVANVLSSVEILWYLFAMAAASSAIIARAHVGARTLQSGGPLSPDLSDPDPQPDPA